MKPLHRPSNSHRSKCQRQLRILCQQIRRSSLEHTALQKQSESQQPDRQSEPDNQAHSQQKRRQSGAATSDSDHIEASKGDPPAEQVSRV